MKIVPVSFQKTSFSSLLTFARKVSVNVEESGIEKEQSAKLKAAYESFCQNYSVGTTKPGISLREIDHDVNLFWRSSRTILKLNLKHPHLEVRELSTQLYDLFQEFGDPTQLSQQRQYGILDALLTRLSTFSEDQLKQCGIDLWIAALREAFQAFCQASQLKAMIRSKVEINITKRVRDEFIEVYNAFVERMNAIAVLQPDDAHDVLARRINTIISELQTSEKAKASHKKEANK